MGSASTQTLIFTTIKRPIVEVLRCGNGGGYSFGGCLRINLYVMVVVEFADWHKNRNSG